MHIHTSDQPEINLGFRGYTCNWGVHICALYTTQEEREEIVNGFVRQGCREGDVVIYCGDHTAFSFSEPIIEGSLQQFTPDQLYYPSGKFEPKEMRKTWEKIYEECKSTHKNLRAIGGAEWSLEGVPGAEELLVYEAMVSEFIPGKPFAAICLYDLNKFDGKTIMHILRTHQFVLNGGVITENPFFQDPRTWLKANAPEYAKELDA